MTKNDFRPLTAKQILEADDLETERVETPEWGGVTLVRSMTAAEKDRYQMSQLTTKGGQIQTDIKKMKSFRARALALTIVDGKNERLFTESQVELLAKKNAGVIDRVYAVVARMNSLTDSSQSEELEKNLSPDPNDVSSSD